MTLAISEVTKDKKKLKRQDTTSLSSDGLIDRLNLSIVETKDKIKMQQELLGKISKNVDEIHQHTSAYIGGEIDA